MATPARRRLMRDYKKLQEKPPAGINGVPTENTILVWDAVIFGPPDTPFENGTFKLSLTFTEEYPNKPPLVKFVSPMFHPNVYADGSICLDILQNRWSPTYDVAAILTSIQSLLNEPNPNSAANSLAAQLYQENRREYVKRVQKIVEQTWLNFAENNGENEDKLVPEVAEASSYLARQLAAAHSAVVTMRPVNIRSGDVQMPEQAAAPSNLNRELAAAHSAVVTLRPVNIRSMPEEAAAPSDLFRELAATGSAVMPEEL